MAAIPYMPLFCEPFLADTDHLNDCELGLYTRMLTKLWLAPGRRFPNDIAWLARKFRRTTEEAENTIMPLVREFFQCDGNWISHARLCREFERAKPRADAFAKRQSRRAKARWNGIDPDNSLKTQGPLNAKCADAQGRATTESDNPLKTQPEKNAKSTSTSTYKERKKESSSSSVETPTPHASPQDGAHAPDDDDIPASLVNLVRGEMPYPAALSLLQAMARVRGGMPAIECGLRDALARGAYSPIAYVRKSVADWELQRAAATAAAIHNADKPPPECDFVKSTRELMEMARAQDIASGMFQGTCDDPVDENEELGGLETEVRRNSQIDYGNNGRRVAILPGGSGYGRMLTVEQTEAEMAELERVDRVH